MSARSSRGNRRTAGSILCLLSASLLGTSPLAQAVPPYEWEVNAGFSYLTGDYGDDPDADMLYVPLTVKRFLAWGDLSLIVPYLSIDEEDTVVEDPEAGVVEVEGDSGSGLGDLILKGRYYIREQEGRWPFIDGVLRLKVPTADEDDLGTGELDLTAGLEVSRWFSRDYFSFFDASYSFIGDPPDEDYDNQVIFDAGVGSQVTRALQVSVFYEYRSAIEVGDPDSGSLLLSGGYRFSPQYKVYGLLEAGLTDGAPDYSLTAGVSRRF
jgi:hypothetical protein